MDNSYGTSYGSTFENPWSWAASSCHPTPAETGKPLLLTVHAALARRTEAFARRHLALTEQNDVCRGRSTSAGVLRRQGRERAKQFIAIYSNL